MGTHLIGQAQTIEHHMAQADGDQRTQRESALAQPIREAARLVAGRALHDTRWIEAMMRLEQPHSDFTSMHPIAFRAIVRRAITAMDALSEAECESWAQRMGL